MSVFLLVGLLPYQNYVNIGISPVLDEISLSNLVGVIPMTFLDYFQIMSNFSCVCQSVSWFNVLPKLCQYRDISSSGWDIFLIFFVDNPSIYLEFFQIFMDFLYVCQSLSQSLISSTWLFLGVNFWDLWSC